MYQAIIPGHLKPVKSWEFPSDFRPISVLNYDHKILTGR